MAEQNDITKLSEVADAVSQTLTSRVLSTTPSYEPLNPQAEGSWRIVSVKNKPVGVLWTDWQLGAGVIATENNDAIKELRNYLTVNKMMEAPAGIAYSTSDTIGSVSLGEQSDGTLENAMIAITQISLEADSNGAK